jgi:hypothetical protein
MRYFTPAHRAKQPEFESADGQRHMKAERSSTPFNVLITFQGTGRQMSRSTPKESYFPNFLAQRRKGVQIHISKRQPGADLPR